MGFSSLTNAVLTNDILPQHGIYQWLISLFHLADNCSVEMMSLMKSCQSNVCKTEKKAVNWHIWETGTKDCLMFDYKVVSRIVTVF